MIYDNVSKQIVKDRPIYEIYAEYAVECFFYLYDGQGFFGFDEQKIHRIRGTPARWYDHFRIKRYLAFKIFLTALFIWVFYKEV